MRRTFGRSDGWPGDSLGDGTGTGGGADDGVTGGGATDGGATGGGVTGRGAAHGDAARGGSTRGGGTARDRDDTGMKGIPGSGALPGGMPGREDVPDPWGGRVRVSPVIPTVANLLLAALWGLSVFAGWGLDAFCSAQEDVAACHDRLDPVAFTSGMLAVAAALCTAGAWLGPVARRDPSRFTVLMASAVLAWILAEGVLFVGGLVNQYPR